MNVLLRRYLAEALDKTHQRKRAADVRHEILERHWTRHRPTVACLAGFRGGFGSESTRS